ncbi:OmpA-like protein [Aureococcus anophagefferens]|nr:OmpA-like protein [Aureococcus anophagefferens]
MAAFTTHGATFDGTLGLVLGCRESDSSAVVVSVKTGGAASTQGVAVGDVIARVNGRRAGDYDGVLAVMADVGRPVTILFEREAPKASVAAGATAAGAAAASSGGVASRWEALQAEHRSHQADKLEQQKTAISADVRDKFRSLELEHAAAQRAEDAAERRAPRPAIENVAAHPDELRIAMSRAPRGMKHVYALVDVSKLEEESAAGVADESHAWRSYERPLHFTAPGRYAVLTKAVPLPRPGQTLASFEQRAAVAEATSSVPEGYAALGNALVDAVAAGLLDRDGAFEILELCATGQVDDPTASRASGGTKARTRRRRARGAAATERAQRAKATRAAAAAATVEGLDFAEAGGGDVVALGAAGDGVFGGGRERVELGAVEPDAFFAACDADLEPVYEPADGEAPLLESKIATAVYELGESPPVLQHEDHAGELRFVRPADAAARALACSKCGRSDDKLYARGDFAICRRCALEGAGVMVDAGARRMWFSQMIQFVGSRAIPLPKSQPLLAQILKVLQAHPGIAVRFEGHVNSKCGLDCDGSGGCPHGSSMCVKCPGGAMGLSTARADAVTQFILACGIEPDRVYAQGFAGTRRLTGDVIDETVGHVNRRVEVHTLLA